MKRISRQDTDRLTDVFFLIKRKFCRKLMHPLRSEAKLDASETAIFLEIVP